MTEISKSLNVCSLTVNVPCWCSKVRRLNEDFASIMMPVVILMVSLMIIGILGNTIVLYTYCLRQKRTTADIFFMYLAGTDLMACAVIHPYVIFKLFHSFSQTSTASCKIFEFTIHASLAISGLSLLAIALDRYLAICRPMKHRGYLKHIYKIVVATFTVGIVGSLPLLEFYGPLQKEIQIEDYIVIGYRCDYMEKYKGDAMTWYSGFVVMGFLMEIVAMVVLYTKVAIVAYRRRRKVQPLSEPVTTISDCFTESAKTSTSHSISQTRRLASLSPVTTVTGSQDTEKPRKVDILNVARNTSKRLEIPIPFRVGESSHTSPPLSSTCTTTSSGSFLQNNKKFQNVHQTKNLSPHLRAAKILFLVTAVFLLSWLPFFILRICDTAGLKWMNTQSLKVLEHFLNHCFYINNAANPVIYSVINKSFRQEAWKLLKKIYRLIK